MSSSKAKKKIDKILELVQERVGDEVGSLMGATLTMSDFSTRLISKEDFFDEAAGKLVFSEMELTGEIEGDGCILISIKDAVRLGGTLIMLPDNELEEVVSSEDYSEEIDDSYGEIANIIAGAYTATFEEMYSKSFRFVRKNQEIITPLKVDVESDKPVPNQNYYQVTTVMKLNDSQMGNLILLIPAKALGLDEETPTPQEQPQEITSPKTEGTESATTDDLQSDGDSTASETVNIIEGDQVEEGANAPSVETAPSADKPVDIKKQKKRVDACLKECNVRMADEVGAMLGAEVQLTEHATKIVNKEDFFFDEASGKQVLAHMDVVGELEGKGFLYIGLKDAIFIGGTLIMLPPSELEVIIAEEDFNDDSEDAYGEIANIISGVYTAVFEEQYPQKLRFVKTSLEQVVPMKVDAESDEPMPEANYYMATSKITIGGKPLGKLQMLVPATLYQLDQLGQEMASADDAPAGASAGASAVGDSNSSFTGTTVAGASERGGVRETGDITLDPEFLLVSNDGEECSKVTSVLSARGINYKVLDYKESVSNYLPGNVKAVFLVMKEVDEKGLGAAIKTSTASSLPLIAVGPGWTRTKVIKAVKYGVDDILLSPASDNDIAEKIDSVSAKIAA